MKKILLTIFTLFTFIMFQSCEDCGCNDDMPTTEVEAISSRKVVLNYGPNSNKNSVKEFKFDVDGETWTVYKWNGEIVHMVVTSNSDFNSRPSTTGDSKVLNQENFFDF